VGISRIGQLLWKVHPKIGSCVSPVKRAVKEGEALEMGDEIARRLAGNQTAVKFSRSIMQLQPEMDFKTSL
jgi:hypothetical protein